MTACTTLCSFPSLFLSECIPFHYAQSKSNTTFVAPHRLHCCYRYRCCCCCCCCVKDAPSSRSTALQYTAPHRIAIHCTSLHFTALHHTRIDPRKPLVLSFLISPHITTATATATATATTHPDPDTARCATQRNATQCHLIRSDTIQSDTIRYDSIHPTRRMHCVALFPFVLHFVVHFVSVRSIPFYTFHRHGDTHTPLRHTRHRKARQGKATQRT